MPHIYLFIAFEGQNVTGTAGVAYYMYVMLTTCRSCKVKPSKACKHDRRPRVQLQIAPPPHPPPYLLGDADFNYIISSFFSFSLFGCRGHTSSGLNQGCIRKEAVVCRIFDLDLIYCRCERMRGTAGGEGKSGRKDRRILSRETGFCLEVSAELWASHLIMWVCHAACLLPFLWGA